MGLLCKNSKWYLFSTYGGYSCSQSFESSVVSFKRFLLVKKQQLCRLLVNFNFENCMSWPRSAAFFFYFLIDGWFFFFTFIIVESVVFVCACTSLLLLLLRIVTGRVPHHDNSVACNASVSETQHILKYAKLKLIVALMLVKFQWIFSYNDVLF